MDVKNYSVFFHGGKDGIVAFVRDDSGCGIGCYAFGVGFDTVDDPCGCGFGDYGGGDVGGEVEGH